LDEIAYIATARWPGFVQPLIDEHVRVQAEIQEERVAMMEAGEDVELEEDPENVWPEAPSEETRVRLLRHFTPTFTHALEQLYPRYQDAATWVFQTAAEDTSAPSNVTTDNAIRLVQSLSRIGKFLLLAAYLASTNPAKSDVRIFGRLNDGRGRMKKGGGTKKARLGSKSGVNKVGQALFPFCSPPLMSTTRYLNAFLDRCPSPWTAFLLSWVFC
jgi:origin recognition complex subunit 5